MVVVLESLIVVDLGREVGIYSYKTPFRSVKVSETEKMEDNLRSVDPLCLVAVAANGSRARVRVFYKKVPTRGPSFPDLGPGMA